MVAYLVTTLALALGIQLALFLTGLRRARDSKLLDLSYAVTFAVLAGFGLAAGELEPGRLALAAIIIFWAVRVAAFAFLGLRFEGFGNRWLMRSIGLWLILLPALMAFRLPGL